MKNVFVFLCLIIIVTACKKYEEGPLISLRSANARIENHWKIASFTVDGIDSMQVVHDLHLQGEFNFVPHSNSADPPLYITTVVNDTTYVYRGLWTRWDKAKELSMATGFIKINNGPLRESAISGPPLFGSQLWRITRLKYNQDMWLELEKDDKLYELKFKAK